MISLICCLLRFYLPDVFGKGRFYWEMLLQTNGAMVGCCVCAWSLAGLWMVALGASVIVLMPDVSLCAGIVAMCGIAGGPLLAILNVLFVCGTYHNMAVHLWRHHDGRHPPLRSLRLCGHMLLVCVGTALCSPWSALVWPSQGFSRTRICSRGCGTCLLSAAIATAASGRAHTAASLLEMPIDTLTIVIPTPPGCPLIRMAACRFRGLGSSHLSDVFIDGAVQ